MRRQPVGDAYLRMFSFKSPSTKQLFHANQKKKKINFEINKKRREIYFLMKEKLLLNNKIDMRTFAALFKGT